MSCDSCEKSVGETQANIVGDNVFCGECFNVSEMNKNVFEISRRKRMLETLKNMGYEISVDSFTANIRIILKTKKGYVVSQMVEEIDLYKPYIIETIVGRMNELIAREL